MTIEYKKLYNRLISLGSDNDTRQSKLKRIKLLNGFCYVWHFFTILIFIEDFFFEQDNMVLTIFVCSTMFVLIVMVQVLNYYQNFMTACVLYIFSQIALIFLMSNYLGKAQFMEYYYLFPPATGLMFINSKTINYVILGISYLSLFLPNLYFEHYPISDFNDMNISFQFFGVFIAVNYFKNINRQNELSLEYKSLELERINRFQSQFFVNISHEIKTPLTLMSGQIDLLKELPNSQSGVGEVEKNLKHQISKIANMVDEVLDLVKMKESNFKLNPHPTNISDIIKKLHASFLPNFELKRIKFSLIKSPKDYIINADPVNLERALNNILTNALKYTDKGGEVSIKLEESTSQVKVVIEDTGIGISSENINEVCKQFYQVDNDINRAGGSGIGLAFSKEIIELHNGQIRLSSKLNEGSKFEIVLPSGHEVETLNDTSKIVTSGSPSSLILPTGEKSLLLIVDDNQEMRQYLKSILKEYECLEAVNGLDALDAMEHNSIDFVIADYMMPKMDGLSFIRALKERKYTIPVLMLTARADRESRLNVFRLGIDDYLNKPFEKDELLIRIKNALNNYKTRIAYIASEQFTFEEVDETTDWIKQVEYYIEQKCSDPQLKQLDIAHRFNLSESSLYRKIKSASGKSPNEFITEVKLQKARRIVESNREISLKKLSLEVGFLHNYYFSKRYHERFGYWPLKEKLVES